MFLWTCLFQDCVWQLGGRVFLGALEAKARQRDTWSLFDAGIVRPCVTSLLSTSSGPI